MSAKLDFEFDLYRERIVTSVIALAGGRLVGRVRLQKVIYLLDQLGLDSGYSYEYHHYGPYSEELSESAEFAKAFGLIKEETAFRDNDGSRYNVFLTEEKAEETCLGAIGSSRAKALLDELNSEGSTILELASTIHWLRHFENVEDWKAEIVRRKGVKTNGGRLEKAMGLLDRIGLAA